MELLVIGIIVALNIIIVMLKVRHSRTADAILDASLLLLVTIVFGGSYAGLVVATVASLIISIYLFLHPPIFFSGKDGWFTKFKQELKDF